MEIDNRVYLSQINSLNKYMHDKVRNLFTSAELLRSALKMAQERTNPPDILETPKGDSSKKFSSEGLYTNIIYLYGSIDEMEYPSLNVSGSLVPVTTQKCKIVKALVLASVTPNEEIASSIMAILSRIMENLVSSNPLHKGFLLKDLNYYQKEAIRAVKILSEKLDIADSFSPEMIDEMINAEIVLTE